MKVKENQAAIYRVIQGRIKCKIERVSCSFLREVGQESYRFFVSCKLKITICKIEVLISTHRIQALRYGQLADDLAFLESIFLSLIEQVCLCWTQIDNFWASIPLNKDSDVKYTETNLRCPCYQLIDCHSHVKRLILYRIQVYRFAIDLHPFPALCIPCSNMHLTPLFLHKSRIFPRRSHSCIHHRFAQVCMDAHMNRKLGTFHRISHRADQLLQEQDSQKSIKKSILQVNLPVHNKCKSYC